jgi:hypothetical protein
MPDISFLKKHDRGTQTATVGTASTAPTPNVIDGLQGVAVKTQLVGKSTKVVLGSQVVANINHDNIAGWTKQGAVLKVTGANPITLNFLNASEAIIAEQRLTNSINGINVV